MKVHPTTNNIYELFKEYEVPAKSIEDFLLKYSRPGAHSDRGEDFVQERIQSHKKDFEKYGYTFITHHDSKTGNIVSYYGNIEPVCETCPDSDMCDQVKYDCPELYV